MSLRTCLRFALVAIILSFAVVASEGTTNPFVVPTGPTTTHQVAGNGVTTPPVIANPTTAGPFVLPPGQGGPIAGGGGGSGSGSGSDTTTTHQYVEHPTTTTPSDFEVPTGPSPTRNVVTETRTLPPLATTASSTTNPGGFPYALPFPVDFDANNLTDSNRFLLGLKGAVYGTGPLAQFYSLPEALRTYITAFRLYVMFPADRSYMDTEDWATTYFWFGEVIRAQIYAILYVPGYAQKLYPPTAPPATEPPTTANPWGPGGPASGSTSSGASSSVNGVPVAALVVVSVFAGILLVALIAIKIKSSSAVSSHRKLSPTVSTSGLLPKSSSKNIILVKAWDSEACMEV